MSIRIKLLLGFALMIVMVAAVAIVSWTGTLKVEGSDAVVGGMSRLHQGLMEAEMQRERFRVKPTRDSADRVVDDIEALQGGLQKALDDPVMAGMRDRLARIVDEVTRFRAAFGLYANQVHEIRDLSERNAATTRDFHAIVADLSARSQTRTANLERLISTVDASLAAAGETGRSDKIVPLVMAAERLRKKVALGREAQALTHDLEKSILGIENAQMGYQIDGSPESEGKITAFAKKVYVSALKLKKIDPKGSGEKVKKLMKMVSAIRKNFARMQSLQEERAVAYREMVKTATTVKTEIANGVAYAEAGKQDSIRFGSRLLIAGVVAALMAGLIITWTMSRTIVGPVTQVIENMERLRQGNYDVEVGAASRHDEFGLMLRSVEMFRQKGRENERLHRQQEELEARHEKDRKVAMRQMAEKFESTVGKVMETVTSATNELRTSSSQMTATATETISQTTTVADASEKASTNVQTVASTTERLTTSIDEIARQVAHSSDVATKATQEAGHTTRSVRALSENVGKIGEIINLINDIAEQTNLLALNATIEAARAGDAGKGFAVVASEVKNLANQTAKATDEIAAQIAAVQDGTEGAVTAINSISGIIEEMSEISSSVASAVQEQTTATNEIAHNVDEAAMGARDVSTNIARVEDAARKASEAAMRIQNSTGDLSDQTAYLRDEVSRFLDQIRSDGTGSANS